MASVNVLQDSGSNLKPAKNPVDLLHSKLRERAQFAYYAEQNDEKPHRCIGLPQICATDSDVDVAKRGGAPQPPATSNDDALAVAELLPLVKNENSIGRDEEKEQLLSLLLSPDQRRTQLSVVSVVGSSGMGKTALARQIYEDRRVEDHFNLKAWVRIDGQQQGDHQLSDIARKLLKSATGMLCSFNDLVEMHEIVVDTLLSHRSLIVLDDFDFMDAELWQIMEDTWFRFVGVGSKVLITTRKREIGIGFAGGSVPFPFYVGKLSLLDSFSLYSSLAGRLDRRVAGRCQGVPLSLKLLGSLMRFDQSRRSSYLMDIIDSDASFEDTSFVLLISVLSLPDNLFSCFAFCGIFPDGYVLEKEKLIKMWIANDVVKPSMEEIGEACFHQLLCRSFFTDVTCDEYGEVQQARMPQAVHESARSIARVMSRNKVAYAFRVDANCLGLSIAMPLIDQQESYQTPYNTKHLQTLVSFPPKNPNPLNIETRSFIELKRLRSLDLSRCGIRKLSKHVCMLRKLRYLNLSYNLLTKLPKSFTTLTRLQTLDLSRCYYLKFLPKKISNLSKLRHLDLSHCNSLSSTPFGVGRLHSLITMPLYVLGERDSKCATLGELRLLKNLRGLLHIRNLEHVEVEEARAADLKQKKLHHLRLSWSRKQYECSGKALLEFLEPNPQLRVLELAGYGDREFPPWMPNLRFLVKLLINDCGFDTPKLGQLQFLKELELKQLINISSIGQEFYGNGDGDGDGDADIDVFPSLEKLKLHGMPNLSIWYNHHTSSNNAVFTKLKKLSIQDCPELQTLPLLPSVTELVVWRSHAKILPWLTRTGSLSSIVANDMNVKESLKGSSAMNSVKKLILVRSNDLDVLESSHINNFASLQHLRILHCIELKRVKLSRLGSLEKLDVVDCQNLERVDIITEEFTLTELMIEDCPRITTINITTCRLRKLVVRNCPKFSSISPEKIDELRVLGLEFLFIS